MRYPILAVAALALAAAPALAQQRVVNPRITTDSSIDTSSADAVLAQILTPGMTDEQKAIACWRFMLDHFYHWFPPYENSSDEPVRDFAKAINSYGFSPCFGNAPVLTDLWEAAGLKTRSWTITGHAIPEVFYDGAWHMLDADARAFHRKADGSIASVAELAADEKLILDPPGGKSDPFYPFGGPGEAVAPLIPWGPPATMASLYRSGRNNYRYNRRAVLGHPMYLNLRPGMELTLNRENVGKWYRFRKLPKDMVWRNAKVEGGEKIETKLDTGPSSIDGKLTYGNGTLNWSPDLKTISAEDLLWQGSENVKLEGGQVVQADKTKPGVAVFRVFCPWVLVEAKALLAGRMLGDVPAAEQPKVALSTDGGHAWFDLEPAWKVRKTGLPSAEIDLTEHVAGEYAYQLRVTLLGAALRAIELSNLFQVSQLSLPRLKEGTNQVKVFRGPDLGVVKLVQSSDKAAKERYVVQSKGLNLNKSLSAKKEDEPATVVFKLTAPADLEAVSIGGLISISRGNLPSVAGEVSFDDGATWTKAFKIEKNDNGQNTQFEQDVRLAVPEGVATREALFRYTIAGYHQHKPGKQAGTLNSIRLYAHYKLPQPAGAKLKVDLTWTEAAGEKSASKVVDAFPTTFEVECGKNPAIKSIVMTPVE